MVAVSNASDYCQKHYTYTDVVAGFKMDLTDFCYTNYLQYSHNIIDRCRKKFNVIIGRQQRCHWY